MNDNEILKKLVRIAKRQQTIIGKIAQLSEQSASPMQTEENQKNENFKFLKKKSKAIPKQNFISAAS